MTRDTNVPDMTQRIALITGGAGGIGSEAARWLARNGRAVAVADLDGATSDNVAAGIRAEGGRAMGVVMDVTEGSSVEAAVAAVEAELGPIEVLVNAVGWDRMHPFLDTDEEFWHEIIDINYVGMLRCNKAVAKGMTERGWGRIVNVASDAGRVGSSLEGVYSGAKGGVIAFSKTLARELAKKGVTVNVVCPGPTDTALLAEFGQTMPDGGKKLVSSLSRAIPMGRIAVPADVAPAIGFFASDEAGFVTGQTLSVSGGLTMA